MEFVGMKSDKQLSVVANYNSSQSDQWNAVVAVTPHSVDWHGLKGDITAHEASTIVQVYLIANNV